MLKGQIPNFDDLTKQFKDSFGDLKEKHAEMMELQKTIKANLSFVREKEITIDGKVCKVQLFKDRVSFVFPLADDNENYYSQIKTSLKKPWYKKIFK